MGDHEKKQKIREDGKRGTKVASIAGGTVAGVAAAAITAGFANASAGAVEGGVVGGPVVGGGAAVVSGTCAGVIGGFAAGATAVPVSLCAAAGGSALNDAVFDG